MTEAKSVNATFELAYSIMVTKSGSGSGTVTSDPVGIDCGEDCFGEYLIDSAVTLSASPDIGSIFTGWNGACTGTGTCTVTMTEAKSLTASFELLYLLSAAKAGTGNGTVTSDPAGMTAGQTARRNMTPARWSN